jgi:integrase
VFEHARARGLRDDNPVEGTIKRVEVVQRQRLAREAFDAIRGAAEPWFVRALDLALHSLQRREDLAVMRVEHWSGGKLEIRQGKVAGRGLGLLRVTPWPELLGAIVACLNSPERGDCPFLLHRTPEKRRQARGRDHFGQLAPEMLSREFQRLRDALGLFDSLPALARPSFHEIRALGADEYRRRGWPETQVQALLGHADVEMTRHYLDRHGERWGDIEAPASG